MNAIYSTLGPSRLGDHTCAPSEKGETPETLKHCPHCRSAIYMLESTLEGTRPGLPLEDDMIDRPAHRRLPHARGRRPQIPR
jgi:hypothetical protein